MYLSTSSTQCCIYVRLHLDDVPQIDGEKNLNGVSVLRRRRRHVKVVVILELDQARLEVVPLLCVRRPRRQLVPPEGIRIQVCLLFCFTDATKPLNHSIRLQYLTPRRSQKIEK